MIYRGTVRHGVVVLPSEFDLPDGTEVIVQPVQPSSLSGAPRHLAGVVRNGVPVFPRTREGKTPDLETVNALRDETP